MPYLLAVLLAVGLLMLWLSGRMRRETGLPGGRIVSQDTLRPRRAGDVLYDPVLDLTGRPDYLVEHGNQWVPVEVKSGGALAGPRAGHRLQLAAYCRLVEAVYARRPPHGILQYADRSYAIAYTADQEAALRETLEAMRADLRRPLDRSHESRERCRACGYRERCDQALA
jgi:CRISPR-associated exonuclease Cas4